MLLHPATNHLALVGGQVVQDHVDRGAVRAGGPDRFQRSQRIRSALVAAVDAPEGVVADRVAPVEAPGTVGAVVRGRVPLRVAGRSPARPSGGTDTERAELVEGKDPVREAVQDLLDPVQLHVAARIWGFLPGLCALEGDAAAGEQST